MNRIIRCFCILSMLVIVSPSSIAQSKQAVSITSAKFATGDNPEWSKSDFDDSKWAEIKTNQTFEKQGFTDYNGYAWYRLHLTIPSSLRDSVTWKKRLRIFLSRIDDTDVSFLNGEKIGQTGRFPEEAGGYETKWNITRDYQVTAESPSIRWDRDNVIAIRMYDGGGAGGIFGDTPFVDMMDLIDGIKLTSNDVGYSFDDSRITATAKLRNQFDVAVKGTLKQTAFYAESGRTLQSETKNITILPNSSVEIALTFPQNQGAEIHYEFKESTSGKSIRVEQIVPYLLTPAVSPKPKVNGARVYGVRPNSPFLFKIPATGSAPMKFSAANLPKGLKLDPNTGIITGSLDREGSYNVLLTAQNKLGKDTRNLEIRAGNLLALTPPMGWNSWNAWGLSVNDSRVRSSAKAFIEKGLINHGWNYVNIDDGWEAAKRAPSGEIVTNEKFPDMKGLSGFLHGEGLKFGIYSSPGPLTCGGFLGSYQHELQDAATYAGWGIDYLKYDLCSYSSLMSKARTLDENQEPYRLMQRALGAQNRDIIYSLCQYGLYDVWKWGETVNGNSWRTTGDIEDTWESLSEIGFSQDKSAGYAKPGRWNDPDMLIVGKLGWSDNLHATRLTPHEQYTHISLWSLLSAPLLLGCDLASLDDFTLNLLTNDEVIAIDQDPLGKAARQKIKKDGYQVWVKELSDGSKAIGIFNLMDKYQKLKIDWKELGLREKLSVRDAWRQKDLGVFTGSFETPVPAHGVNLIVVR